MKRRIKTNQTNQIRRKGNAKEKMRKGTVKNKKSNRKEKEMKRKEGRRTGKEKEKKGEGKRRGATETSMTIHENKSKRAQKDVKKVSKRGQKEGPKGVINRSLNPST